MPLSFFEYPPFQRLLLPNGILGWLVWALLILIAIWLVRRFPGRTPVWKRSDWVWFAALMIAVPISIVAVTVRLPAEGALPIPALGSPALGSLLTILAAIPWVLGLARLGTLPGVLLAAFSGLLLGLWDTRSPFTPVEFALVAALLGAMISQNYRARIFDWLRRPLVAGVVISLVYPLIYIATSFFWASSDPITSFDFALSRELWVSAAFAAQLLVGTTGLQLIGSRIPQFAPQTKASQPAPTERSLEARFLFTLGPVVLLAFLTLAALGWWTAGRAAEKLYSERISASVDLAADSVPFLLETGQNLMLQLAEDTTLADASVAEALAILQSHLRAVPYFEQLVLLDSGGNTMVSFPLSESFGVQSDSQEIEAVGLALQGLALQYFTIPTMDESGTIAQLSFIAPVRNSNNQVRAVLLGRTSLRFNPFAQPIVQSLEDINALGGQGLLLDGEGRIAMSPQTVALLQPYNGRTGETPLAYDDTGPDGARRQVRYQPVTGSNWAVVVQWPARLTQQLALNIALPMLAVWLLLAIVAYLLLRYSLRAVTASLQDLVVDTRRIAGGDLKAPLAVKSADEVGRLGAAFEKMRQTLQTRMEEIQRLLTVSQGVSSTLDIRSQIDPILDAALASNASAARLVFRGRGGGQKPTSFGRGEEKKLHKDLDAQMLMLTEKQDRVLLTNPARARLKVDKGVALPAALATFALRNREDHLGVLWLAFEQPQTFEPEHVRYLETLAEQAAKAAASARLYVDASGGRRRLEAMLKASTDLLLLTDEDGQIVFANSAATELFASSDGNLIGTSLTELLHQPELSELVRADTSEDPIEVQIAGRTYEAKYLIVEESDKVLGHALIMRDVSNTKQTENARIESLATLSHDLRDPLELSKGYLSMLGMVGDLNEQQTSYIEKVEHNLENMQRLVGDMLDLERLGSSRGLQLKETLLPPLLQEAIRELEPRARQKKVGFVLSKPDKVAAIEGDATLLQRAFYNLLDNAIRISPREGQVEIQVAYSKNKALVSITDHGAGIAPVDLPKIFDGGQGNRKRTAGLAIVKSVVERHGGHVWADSELGTGSTFYCELPLRDTQETANPRASLTP
ncbi:MAG: ATP-binding protein [Chloroflexi bacterium]|nr:ATP-binding protein [Chloroflexota bacterium]